MYCLIKMGKLSSYFEIFNRLDETDSMLWLFHQIARLAGTCVSLRHRLADDAEVFALVLPR